MNPDLYYLLPTFASRVGTLRLNIKSKRVRLNMSIEITNYYVPNKNCELVTRAVSTAARGRPRSLKPSGGAILDEILPAGFADAWWCNGEYKELLSNLTMMSLDNNEIYEVAAEGKAEDRDSRQRQELRMGAAEINEKLAEDKIRDVLYYRIIKKWSIKSICAKLQISAADIRSTINYVK